VTEASIAYLVCNCTNSPFYYRRNYCVVPNVSWGIGLEHEADILAVTQSGYMIEGEIKITVSDFKADQKKKKWGRQNKMRSIYYIVLADIQGKVSSIQRPDGTGLISVYESRIEVVERAKLNPDAEQLTFQRQMNLARLGTMRLWDRKKVTQFFDDVHGGEK